MQGVLSPAIGTLVDRLGPRRVILGGVVVLGLSSMLASRIDALWHLYLTTGVLTAIGVCAAGWIATAALLTQWFASRQATMMGLTFSGMGVGVLAIGPLAQWLISTHGWRDAYLVLGARHARVAGPARVDRRARRAAAGAARPRDERARATGRR